MECEFLEGLGCLVSFRQSLWELAKRGDVWGSVPNLAKFVDEDLGVWEEEVTGAFRREGGTGLSTHGPCGAGAGGWRVSRLSWGVQSRALLVKTLRH